MIDLILSYLPIYLAIGFSLVMLIIFSMSSERGFSGMEFFIFAIIFLWFPLLFYAAGLWFRDFLFENLQALYPDVKDKNQKSLTDFEEVDL